MNDHNVKSLKRLRFIAMSDLVFVTALGAYLGFFSREKFIGIMMLIICGSGLATILTGIDRILKNEK